MDTLYANATKQVKDAIINQGLKEYIIEGKYYFLCKVSDILFDYASRKDNHFIYMDFLDTSKKGKSEILKLIENLGFDNNVI